MGGPTRDELRDRVFYERIGAAKAGLERQIDALKNEVRGIDRAIAIIDAMPEDATTIRKGGA